MHDPETLWQKARAHDEVARAELGVLAQEVALRELRARRAPVGNLEDLVQETLRSTFTFLEKERRAPRDLRAFLKFRAWAVLSQARRRRRAMISLDNDADDGRAAVLEPSIEGPGPVSLALRDALRSALVSCREGLTAKQREVLSLRYEAGLESAKIAEELGVARNSVNVHAFRALASLRECLARKGFQVGDLVL